ncbi:DUF4012 domain-containing protein [Sulfobacillus harzensis]|uniref:DUF4012 domain-containing protein n=1 Tax=Sulfobacillus harzensis TaxID=2729629 RepID=A0A7Y0L1V0_9FIRM|nr:DUF4012 domain-containing protein [Sulfobacillus harzensis]NMP21741.1 DUF4012 domain-containing protein [Sulfobacillus harzensis]
MAKDDRPPKRRRVRRRMRWGRFFGFLIFLGVVLPLLGLGYGAWRLDSDVHALKSDYHARNFVAMASSLQQAGGTLGIMRSASLLLGWMDAVPVLRGYYLNGMSVLTAAQMDVHAFGDAIPPVLDAAEGGGSSAAKTARVSQAVSAAGLKMQQLEPQLLGANRQIQSMNAHRWPGILSRKGLSVPEIKAVSDTLIRMLPTMTGRHPILASLMGFPNPKRYLLIFENSGELRATGGFMTAFAYVPFHNGKLGKITSQNIQTLDTQVTYRPTPPTVVGLYLPVLYWHLRDANSAVAGTNFGMPDVPEAVHNIYQFYNSIPNAPPVNGVVFIDTWFVDDLIGDVGGLNVPTLRGKTVHLTAQNANYEMEYMAEGLALPANVRKLFIGTMMKELMHDVFHGHTSELLKVAGTISLALRHEHVMMYFNNPKAEQFVANQNWGGIIPQHVNGDYVEVIDENLLGHKDNYWMHESYDVNIKTENGQNIETVTVHWRETGIDTGKPPYLVVPYHSWVSVFAPPGSTLDSMTATASGGNGAGGGIDSGIQVTDDTVVNKVEFGAHMNLPARLSKYQPDATGTLVATITLPAGVNINHILLQKQPGLKAEPVTVTVNGATRHIVLNSRTWLTF